MSGRLVGYARVSTDEQDTDPQVDRLREAGCHPIFKDDGVSGALASRPDWDRCLKELHAGDTLVATKLDRFGRSFSHLAALFESLESRHVSVRCLDQPIDTTSAVGKLLIGILISFAEFERNLTRERIKDKMKFNAHAGKVARGRSLKRDADDVYPEDHEKAGQPIPDHRAFGFEDDNVTVRPYEADIIRDCAARLLAGESQYSILADLNARKVKTMRGAEWKYVTFRQIMTRAKNAGYHTYRGEIVPGLRLPGEPILDDITYAKIVAMFERRRKGRQPTGVYLLSGLALCHCGKPLAGRPVWEKQKGDTQGRKVGAQYWCPTPHPGRVFIRTGPLDDYIEDWTIKTLADPTQAEALEEEAARIAAERTEIEDAIRLDEELANQVAEKLGRREMTLDRYEHVVKPLDAHIAELRIKLDLLISEAASVPAGRRRAQDAISGTAWARGTLLAEWEDGDVASRRAMVKRALNKRLITVQPGKPGPFSPERVSISL